MVALYMVWCGMYGCVLLRDTSPFLLGLDRLMDELPVVKACLPWGRTSSEISSGPQWKEPGWDFEVLQILLLSF